MDALHDLSHGSLMINQGDFINIVWQVTRSIVCTINRYTFDADIKIFLSMSGDEKSLLNLVCNLVDNFIFIKYNLYRY